MIEPILELPRADSTLEKAGRKKAIRDIESVIDVRVIKGA